MSVYTDGSGTYYQIREAVIGDPAHVMVSVRNVESNTSTSMLASSVPQGGWTVASNLTDVSSGVWTAQGQLVDPS